MYNEGYSQWKDDDGNSTIPMIFNGSWDMGSLKAENSFYENFSSNDIKVATMPSIEGKPGAVLTAPDVAWGVNANSANKEAAWEFVKYWTGEECNKARIGMELPVLNSVVESEGIMDEPEYAPFYEMLEQSDGHTPASFLIEDWSEISENLSLSFEQIFNPSSYMDVKDVLKEAADAQ